MKPQMQRNTKIIKSFNKTIWWPGAQIALNNPQKERERERDCERYNLEGIPTNFFLKL
jgi:hypothetical protein